MNIDYIVKLSQIIKERNGVDGETSYTSKLLSAPELTSRKIGEEAIELIISSLNKDISNIIMESADLLYHLMVLLESHDLSLEDVSNELLKRHGVSGIEEKKSRKK
jgi:phosphoribosyl-ATP pyrophosphohydrolase